MHITARNEAVAGTFLTLGCKRRERAFGVDVMRRSVVRRCVLFACVLLVAVDPLALTLASDSPSGYHWARKQTQFTLEVGDNVDGDWDSLLKQAINEWSDSGTVTMKEI